MKKKIKTFEIAQGETLKRGVDWTKEALGDITSSAWVVSAGLTVTGPAYDADTSFAFFTLLPTVQVGAVLSATNRVAAGGETMERTFQFEVVESKYD